ncbi:class I SAM-dependent methyltransferase [Pseudonocardia acaciae]|uniref:class I SAM-dependent methyltransferase n=1 Tax=Pseudonocardia acaciae TaxID=551276 RepID=UPI0007E8E8B6|nr:class I SAM-dependent methyltransferase [Pseudonocardia acaciae]
MTSATDHFAYPLAGRRCRLERAGATPTRLHPRRWHDRAGRSDRSLLDACRGPTIDLGCGPGRLVAALTERGVPALGVDNSPTAVRLCAARGAPVLRRDLFGPVPGEGRWHHALLADGNIGIGGDPVGLLRRVRRLLHSHGSVLVELAAEPELWRGQARLLARSRPVSGWFAWALVGPAAIGAIASAAGMRLTTIHRDPTHRRAVAHLHRQDATMGFGGSPEV